MPEPKAAEIMTVLDDKIDKHQESDTAHADIRADIEELSERVTEIIITGSSPMIWLGD